MPYRIVIKWFMGYIDPPPPVSILQIIPFISYLSHSLSLKEGAMRRKSPP